MNICLAGEGAMGNKHAQTLKTIQGVQVTTLAGGIQADAAAFIQKWDIPHSSLRLEECLERPGIQAVVLATPNQVHAAQAELALKRGKHVFVELPMALNLPECKRLVALAQEKGLIYMVNHSQRYSASNREIYRQVRQGELHLHHIVQQTYFFRRENINMHGKPRTWTDDLLWHQACHMLDFVFWLLDDPCMEAWGQAGPNHHRLGIPMDITMGLRSKDGTLVTSAHSFNNYGPITSYYRFIGEEKTLLIDKKGFTDHEGNPVTVKEPPVSGPVEHFIECIREGREPLTSCRVCLPTMELIDRIQQSIDRQRSGHR